jgi:hypothetical protein
MAPARAGVRPVTPPRRLPDERDLPDNDRRIPSQREMLEVLNLLREEVEESREERRRQPEVVRLAVQDGIKAELIRLGIQDEKAPADLRAMRDFANALREVKASAYAALGKLIGGAILVSMVAGLMGWTAAHKLFGN